MPQRGWHSAPREEGANITIGDRVLVKDQPQRSDGEVYFPNCPAARITGAARSGGATWSSGATCIAVSTALVSSSRG